jgi:hypothetical protein
MKREILRKLQNTLNDRAMAINKVLTSDEAMNLFTNTYGNNFNKIYDARQKCHNKAIALWEACGDIQDIIDKITN